MFDDLSPLLWTHFIAASIAIVVGAFVFLMRKGTSLHRTMGITYIVAMFVTVVSVVPVEATVMPFFGTRFGFFHVFVVIGFLSLLFGIDRLLKWRRTRDLEMLRAHQIHLGYSYAGLIMAGFSQIASNPAWGLAEISTPGQFWAAFGTVNVVIYAIAIFLIQTRLAKGDPRRWRKA